MAIQVLLLCLLSLYKILYNVFIPESSYKVNNSRSRMLDLGLNVVEFNQDEHPSLQ